MWSTRPIKEKRLQERIRSAVGEVHNLGIADLDLQASNIVLSEDGRDFRFIDFGLCVFRDEVKAKQFKKGKRKDYQMLDEKVFA